MIDIISVSKQYGTKEIFKNASLHMGTRSRLALVGPNGSGKTTLIRMILGEEVPDTGSVAKASHLTIGYLAQETERTESATVLEAVMKLSGRREELLALKAELEEKFAAGKAYDGHEEDIERYGHVTEELEHMDEYRLEARAKEILTGMGFKQSDLGRPVGEFSGGWQMRVTLSRILLLSPDLLLLDEPTNHLDLESLLWLEEWLADYHGALLLVSHDRAFLNRMVREVVEIDQKQLILYKGNLDETTRQKEQRLELLTSQYKRQEEEVARIEEFITRFRYKATKARQVQSRIKMLDKMERVELPGQGAATVHFNFPPAQRSGKQVLTLEDVTAGYDGKTVFRGLEWIIPRGARVAVVGVNGAGKTTLLRLLAGKLAPVSGEIRWGHDVQIGYYAQFQAESLDLKRTVYEELEAAAPGKSQRELRSVAGAFLFSGDAVEKKCKVLSGGEKARVALAKLLLQPHNFLLLDEPTNHLDADSRSVLLEALQEYEGTLCLVSHEREFMSTLVDSVLEIVPAAGGSLVHKRVDTYEDYLARKVAEAAAQVHHTELPANLLESPGEALHQGTQTKLKGKSEKLKEEERCSPQDLEEKKRKKEQEKRRIKLEEEIAVMEARQKELHTLLAEQGTYDNRDKLVPLFKELHQIEKDLPMKLKRWEEMSEQFKGR